MPDMQDDVFLQRLSSEARSHDILIVLNRGGLGYGGISYEREARSIINGIRKFLSMQKLRCKVIPYSRLKNPNIFTKFEAIFRASFAYPQESKYLAETVHRLVRKIPHIRILLLGYSLGGIINTNVMKFTKFHPRVYSIQFGTPFYIRPLRHSRVLDLRNPLDMMSSGNVVSFIPMASISFILGALRILFLIELKLSKAVRLFGHEYAWENKKIRNQIERFLKRYFLNKPWH